MGKNYTEVTIEDKVVVGTTKNTRMHVFALDPRTKELTRSAVYWLNKRQRTFIAGKLWKTQADSD